MQSRRLFEQYAHYRAIFDDEMVSLADRLFESRPATFLSSAPRAQGRTLGRGDALHCGMRAEDGRIHELLDLIRLTDARARPAADLSHGQKQWLEIGMLLAQDPQLLLVDEPAAGMTDAETMWTAELLKSIAGERSVVVVEHDMDLVRELDCKATVLHQGSVLAESSLAHVSAMREVVEVDNVTLHYGAAQALKGVSCTVTPCEVTTVLGRNGVGKTSLPRAISGVSIRSEGAEVSRLSPVERAQRGIAYVPQRREVFPLLTVREKSETGFATPP